MTHLLVVLLTAIPIAVGAACGQRLGGRRLFGGMVLLVASWLLAVGTALLGYRLEWYWPMGLMTPVLAGLWLGACSCQMFKAKLAPLLLPASSGETGFLSDRAIGSLIGSAGGFLCAITLWLVAQLISILAAVSPQADQAMADVPKPTQPQAWASSLVRIANQGFVRHLPLAGQLGEELEAVVYILKTPIERRQDFARYKEWDALAELPTFQAMVDNEQLLLDLDRIGDGNLTALYRLQRHPQVLAFVKEEPLQAMIAQLRASSIAKELAQFGRNSE